MLAKWRPKDENRSENRSEYENKNEIEPGERREHQAESTRKDQWNGRSTGEVAERPKAAVC